MLAHLSAFVSLSFTALGFSQNISASRECSAAELQSAVMQWVQKHDFSGALLYEKHGMPLASMAFGEADREHHVPNAVETPFRIGSITKLFTTAAILREIADGRLKRDTLICSFLADCPEIWKKITVEQALTHTDGMPDIVRQPDFAALATQPTTPGETLARLHSITPLFAPGTDVAYGNTGMIALSVVLEKLSGESYGQALEELVFEPAGLSHTSYDDPATILPGRAFGYVVKNGIVQNAPYIDMTIPSGAGGLVSTVGDLDRFTRAFLDAKLVPLALVREALTPKNTDYGFGWAIRDMGGRREVSHIGDINGFGSFLAHYPSDNTVVVVLTNVERTPVSDLARMLATQCSGASTKGAQ